MTIVDIHTHFLPKFFVDEAGSKGVFEVREKDGLIVHPQGFRYPAAPEFLDAGAKIAQMDDKQIDVSILSSSPTLFFYDQPAKEAIEFAQRSNDALADLIKDQPRLEGFAHLPLQDPLAAGAELERAVKELGLLGAQIGTNCGPTPVADIWPVLEVAERLDVPLMLHPYYVGAKPGLEDFYFVNSAGNLIDTTVAGARLIHSGVLDRFPALRIALVHAGGFLPFQIGRFDHAYSVRPEPKVAISSPPSTYLDRFWMDTITHGDRALGFVRDVIGPSRLVLGTDLPFDMADERPVDRLERVGIDTDAMAEATRALLGPIGAQKVGL